MTFSTDENIPPRPPLPQETTEAAPGDPRALLRARRARKARRVPFIVAGVVGLIIGAVLGAGVTAAVITTTGASAEAAASASADAYRLSMFQSAAATCGISASTVSDGGQSMSLDSAGSDYGSGDLTASDVWCVLEELDTPTSTIEKMQATRALDGRLEDSWNGIEASWSYHPDNGLDVILELEDE